jgi:hypothetical protein
MNEKLVNKELLALTKRSPRTAAEREFHKWLLSWKEKLAVVQCKGGQ